MPNVSADPPETFDLADQQFKAFLAENGYPQEVQWVWSTDVVRWSYQYFIRQQVGDGLEKAKLRYTEGVAKGLGIQLRALCASHQETFATIYVPTDDIDAQYHMMGRGLKLSCSSEETTVCKVRNPFRWFLLLRRDKGQSRLLFE